VEWCPQLSVSRDVLVGHPPSASHRRWLTKISVGATSGVKVSWFEKVAGYKKLQIF